jgi:hypothetical protein
MGLTKPRASQIFDIDYKQATRVITVSNVTLAGGAPSQVDGVNLAEDDRVLVTGQNTASQNGLYFVSSLGTGEDGTWLRTTDGNENGEVQAGMIVMVTEGTVYHDTQWKLTTDDPIVIGTTPLTFVINILSQIGGSNTQIQYNNAGTMGGSANLTWNGSALYINGAVSVTGNVTGNYFIGDGSQLTGISGGGSTAASALTGNTLSSNVINSSLTSVGTLGNLSVAGNTTVGNLLTSGNISTTGNVIGGNLITAAAISGASVSASGNITGGNLIISGSISDSAQLDINTTSANANIVFTPNGTGNVNTGANVSVTGNITGGNVLFGSGSVSGTGNVTGNYFIGNGSQLTGVAMSWSIANSNVTMSVNRGYFVDTTGGAKTMTLPTGVTIGDTVRINDLAGTFGTNNLTVARNGSKIQGVADDLVVSVNQSSFGLVYSNGTYGWKLLEF